MDPLAVFIMGVGLSIEQIDITVTRVLCKKVFNSSIVWF